METGNNLGTKIIVTTVVILALIFAGYFLSRKSGPSTEDSPMSEDGTTTENMPVSVKNTPVVDGVVSTPEGFPSDIPIEKSGITESAVTDYPSQNARQLSLSYESTKTVAQKYAEYKSYMEKAGYQITEGGSATSVRAIFGTKEDANFSVAMSNSGNVTLVQISYLLK